MPTVPGYYRSRRGRVFRIQRGSEDRADGGVCYRLRAFQVGALPGVPDEPVFEWVEELDPTDLRDQLQRHQVVATPEQTFESIWQRVRMEIDSL